MVGVSKAPVVDNIIPLIAYITLSFSSISFAGVLLFAVFDSMVIKLREKS